MKNLREIVSIGDCIPEGFFYAHSVFERVINYTDGENLVSLVTEDVGSSPYHIVFKNLPEKTDSLEISPEKIVFGNSEIIRNIHSVFSSSVESFSFDFVEKSLSEIKANPLLKKSFFFPRETKSAFERNMIERLVKGADFMRQGNFEKGVPMLKGCGFGLTPSGDDFLSGFLYALYLADRFLKRDLSLVRKEIYQASLGKNLISNSYLRTAYLGLFNERFKEFLSAFSVGENMEKNIEKMADTGETSGTDTMHGFVTGVEYLNV